MEESKNETPLAAAVLADTEKPAASASTEPEKTENLENINKTEEAESHQSSSELKDDNPECSKTQLVDADMIDALLDQEADFEAMEATDDLLKSAVENLPESLLEELEPLPEIPVELPPMVTEEHVDVSQSLEDKNVTETLGNVETSKESPKKGLEESSEPTADQLNTELEIMPTEISSENEEAGNIADDVEENIKLPEESSNIISEESSEISSDKMEEPETSAMEITESIDENSSLAKEINEDTDKVKAVESSETCSEKIIAETEKSSSDVTELDKENPSLTKDMNKETDIVLSDETLETISDKVMGEAEKMSEDITEVNEEMSSVSKNVNEEIDNVLSEESSENKLDKSDKPPEKSPECLIESDDKQVAPTEDKPDISTESDDKQAAPTEDKPDISTESDDKQIAPTEDKPDISTEVSETKESESQIPQVTETSKEEEIDSTSKTLDSCEKVDETTKEKKSETVTMKSLESFIKEAEELANQTSAILGNETESTDTSKGAAEENIEDLDLISSDSSKGKTDDNSKSANKKITETSNLEIAGIGGSNSLETLEPMDTYDSQESVNLVIDETDLEAENKDETSEVTKGGDKQTKMDVDQEKNISKQKEKSKEHDLHNKSKDDDVIPVEQPPVPIIEIEDDDFETEIPHTIIQEITEEDFMKLEDEAQKSITTDVEMTVKNAAPQSKESLLEVACEKSLEELLKSQDDDKENEDGELEDTTDEVFYNKECINYECPHKHKQFFKVPQFAFSFFKVTKKKFKIQYICADCYDKALEMYEEFCGLINFKQPLLLENIPTGRQEFVEIIDSSDDEDTNDKRKPTDTAKSAFSKNDLSLIEMELHNTIKSVLNRVEIQNQLTWSKTILLERLKRLEMDTDYVDSELRSLQRKADKMHEGLYSCPKIKIRQLQPLDLNSGKAMAFESHTQKEVQPIPPVGEIERPPIKLNSMYYAVKNNPIASWVPCKVIEQVEGGIALKNVKHYKIKYIKSQVQMPKNVPAKYLAYFDPPTVRLPIGTRVIAYFDATSLARGREKINVQSAFYPGIIAEPLKPNNKFRYLIFYDDGYTQYVYHKDVRLVCHVSESVWEDVHPASRDFIQKYLTQYSINRPMVQTQKGQSMNTESNGYWLHARVVDIDCSLVLMQFEGSKSHTEWIYRGSLRLGPVFKEYQKTLKNSSMPVSRLPRRTEPFIRYTEDEESSSQQQQQTDKAAVNDSNRAVARKTFGRPDSMMNSASTSQPQQQAQTNVPAVKHLNNSTIYVEDENKPKGKVVYYTAKRNLPPRKYKPHRCNPSCLFEVTHNLSAYSPLSKPLLSGWERFVIRQKIKKVVTYRAPCGKIMRHMKELHHYLRVTNNVLNVDNFDFSHETNCLAEYVIESAIVQKRDISNGQEKMAIPLVNYYDNTLPPECVYSAKVIPTEGVHINTNPEFLIGCDCDDDCADKTKCACWQLTLTGAKYGNPNAAPEEVGYQYRRLLDHVPTGIYECNANCKCKSSCLNRVVQNSLTMKLQVFKTSNRGWGLRCINDIPRGSFVCVYAGHLLTEAKANEGGQDAGDEYFAELDYIEVAEQIKEGYESEVEMPYAEEEEAYNPEGEDDEFTPSRSFLTRAKQKQNATKSTRIDEDSQERQVINFNPNADMNEDSVRENSIRQLYGKDEACYVMDAKISGNLGRYFNSANFINKIFLETNAEKMNAQLNAELESARQCLLETYQLALVYGDEASQDPNKYLEMAAQLITTKENAKRTDDALEVAKEQRTIEAFEQEFQKQLRDRLEKRYDAQRTTEFKNFKQQLQLIQQEMEEGDNAASGSTSRIESDDFVMESEINVYDPLTKQRMHNPMRNTLCNHHYEKSSILEAIQINKRLRCPVAGCGNKQFVIQQHLVDDKVFQLRLQKMADQQGSQDE